MGPAAVRTASHLPASPRAPPLPLTVYGAYWRRRPLSRFCPDMLLTLRPAAFLCHERRTFLGVTVPSPPVVSGVTNGPEKAHISESLLAGRSWTSWPPQAQPQGRVVCVGWVLTQKARRSPALRAWGGFVCLWLPKMYLRSHKSLDSRPVWYRFALTPLLCLPDLWGRPTAV